MNDFSTNKLFEGTYYITVYLFAISFYTCIFKLYALDNVDIEMPVEENFDDHDNAQVEGILYHINEHSNLVSAK